ncbi:MAG: ATP-binding protein [Cytophagales bacterium]|nr:ATP-binding protein [Cytophagales bacterium]
MIYRRFYIGLWVRVVFIVLNSIFLAFAYYTFRDWLLNINLFVMLGVQTWLLLRYINKTNLDLSNFFLSVQFDDASVSFSKNKYGRSFDRLYESLELVNDKFLQLREAEEKQTRFLRAVADHIKIGIIVFDEAGNIHLSNKTALSLFDLPYLKDLNQFNEIQEGLTEKLIKAGGTTREVIAVKIVDAVRKILVRANEYRVREKHLKIISFQDIESELEDHEIDSWQKLIRILSHEIMNSVGPIKSTIETIEHILTRAGDESVATDVLTKESISDINRGIAIVKERSIGMSAFVEHFRSFTELPKPVFKEIKVVKLINSLRRLFQSEFDKNSIDFIYRLKDQELSIYADQGMVEQMFINIMTNAIQAEPDTIALKVERTDNFHTEVEITDNGRGILPENLDKVFIPFFTTKEYGTGVGLSLARQIMRCHKGSISVHSRPGEFTIVRITF